MRLGHHSRPAILIFLVLGTIMMGLATPTEAGAMGTIGAIVLAVVRNAPLTRFDKWVFGAGVGASGVGFVIGLFAFKSLALQGGFHGDVRLDRLAVLAGLGRQVPCTT